VSGPEDPPPKAAPDPRAPANTPAYRRAMVALFCAGLATFIQLYSPQGLLPDIAREFGISAGTSSWAVGAATIGVAAGVLPWARLSDRIGRVRAMRWAVLAAVVVGLVLPLAPSFEALVAIRVLEGLALAGIPAIAVTALAEMVRPAVLGVAIGTYIAGNTVGGLTGRIVAAEAAEPWDWRLGLAVVAMLAALCAVGFLVLVPPTAMRPAANPPLLRAVLANLRNPGVMVAIAQAFLLMGGFVAAYNYLTFRLQQPPFGLSLAQVSWIFLAYLAGAAASRWVWRIVPRLSPTGTVLLSAAVMIAGLALTLAPSLPLVIVGLVLFTGAFFAAHSVTSAVAPRRATEGRSLVPPLYNLGYYSGSSLLGWVGGLFFAVWEWPGTVGMIAGSTLLGAALAWGYAIRRGGLLMADR
jgi:predicted MFS family arabinose efflux permease